MTYIIGEIGQNHNGSVKIAKRLLTVPHLLLLNNYLILIYLLLMRLN